MGDGTSSKESLYCLFCHHQNRRSATSCAHCGARLVSSDDTLAAEVEQQKAAFHSQTNLTRYEQFLRQLAHGVLALFFIGRDDPIILPHLKTLILGRDSTQYIQQTAEEKKLDLSGFGRLTHSISRRHAMIVWTADGFTLSDLGSTNGTWLNQEMLQPGKAYHLQSYDQVRLGLFTLMVGFQVEKEGMKPVKMVIQGRNTLAAGQHMLTAAFLSGELSPYLQALNELQQVIALCNQHPARELNIQEVSEQQEGVTLTLELTKSAWNILRHQLLPWRTTHADFIGKPRKETNAMFEEAITELVGRILSANTPGPHISPALKSRLSTAVQLLISSRLEPLFWSG
jgi:hypothetical protein